ncbi:MAG: hypothetical protein RR053_00055 [Evtepia sp.]
MHVKKHFYLPILAFLGSVGGLALRKWQLASAFDPISGLPIGGRPASAAMLIFSVFFCGILLWFSIRKEVVTDELQETQKVQPIPTKRPMLVQMSMMASAFLTLIGAFVMIRRFLTKELSPLWLLVGILFVLSAFSVVLRLFKPETGRNALLIPAFTTCIWLMASYQAWAQSPSESEYVFTLLAVVFAMLAHYYLASLSFDRPHTGPASFFCLASVYCALVCLADGQNLETLLLMLSLVLYFIPSVFLLLRDTQTIKEDLPA